MIITVHLHTILQRQTPEGLIDRIEVTLPAGNTLADLLVQAGVEMAPESLLMAVNGRVADLDQVLKDGDRVNLMPAISGGATACGWWVATNQSRRGAGRGRF